MRDCPSTGGQSLVRPPLPRRELLLFLVAILTPCLVLVVLSLRILDQERQLEQKRAAEEREQQVAWLSQDLISRLERTKVDLAFSPVSATDELIAFVGTLRSGQLVLPWDENTHMRDFRQAIGRARLSGLLRQAERDEPNGSPGRAVEACREAIRVAPSPAAQAYVRLLLARALRKAGRHQESLRQHELVFQSPPDLVDEYGIPLALYATPPLLARNLRKVEILQLARALTGSRESWSPAALYMLQDLVRKLAAPDLEIKLASRIHDCEQAEALRQDSARLLSLVRTSEPIWIPYGEPPWLLSIAPRGQLTEPMVIAVRLRVLTARLNLPLARIWPATNGAGEPLGKSFPGLRVTIAAGIEPGSNSRQRLIIFALALVLVRDVVCRLPAVAGRAPRTSIG